MINPAQIAFAERIYPSRAAIIVAAILGIMVVALACGNQPDATDDALSPLPEERHTPPAVNNQSGGTTSAFKRSSADTETANPVRPSTNSKAATRETSQAPDSATATPVGSASPSTGRSHSENTQTGNQDINKQSQYDSRDILYLIHFIEPQWQFHNHVPLEILSNKVIEQHPDYSIAYLLRGKARIGSYRYDDAIADLDKAIELGPGPTLVNVPKHVSKHNPFLASGELQDRNIYAQELRAYALIKAGKPQEAVDALQAATRDWSAADTLLTIAHYHLGNYGDAQKHCCSIEIPPMRNDIAEHQLERIPDLDVSLKLNPDDQHGFVERAAISNYFGAYDRALEDLDTAGIDNDRVKAIRESIYNSKGQFDLVIPLQTEKLEQSKADPQNPRNRPSNHYMRRGITYLRNGQNDAAMQDFQNAVQSVQVENAVPGANRNEPRERLQQLLLAYTMILAGRTDEAFDIACTDGFSCAIARPWHLSYISAAYSSQNPHLHAFLGLTMCSQFEDGIVGCVHAVQALYHLEQALAIDPGIRAAQYGKALAESWLNGYLATEAGRQAYDRALELAPEKIGLIRARLLFDKNKRNYAHMLADLETLIEQDFDNAAEYYFLRGFAHSRLENKTEAEAALLKAAELGYDQDEIKEELLALSQ